jgi:hypothetical protein
MGCEPAIGRVPAHEDEATSIQPLGVGGVSGRAGARAQMNGRPCYERMLSSVPAMSSAVRKTARFAMNAFFAAS